jgi:O-acetyl-ADP-ribose deacetylase (regulator of RNase III)
MKKVELKFFSYNQPELHDAWNKYLGDLDFISIHQGDILKEPSDCVVSPANSFGYMDGGIDRLYTKFFGQQLQERLQYEITEYCNGELLVGQALCISTRHTHIPYMISAPTMRLPTKLDDRTENPYLAMRGIILLVKQKTITRFPTDIIKTISFPGFCTGVGGVSAEKCAAQIRRAIDDHWLGMFKFPKKFDEAVLPFTNRTAGDYKNAITRK